MTGFWVYNNQLTGTVPGGYGDWTSMTNFDCSYNSINGTLPDSFGQWMHLEEFKVCTNMLFGTLPAVYSNFVVSFVTVSYNGFSGTLPPEYGASWGPTIRSFYAADNQLRGIIPASYAAWTSLQIFDATKNSLEGTLPLMISAWTQMTALTLGNNRFTGTIPASYAALRGSLVTMYLYCNQLEGGLPDEFRSMSALRSLFLNGNQNLTGSLPSSWGTPTNILRLASFSLQNTSITGSIPPTWSSVILPQGFIALCGTDVCGAGGLTGSYSLCVDDVAACDPRNQSYFIAHSTLYLPPACSSNNNSTPAPSSAATSLAPTPPPSAFSIPANHSKSNAQDWDHCCIGWFSIIGCRQLSSCRRNDEVGDVW
ncbi:GP46-like surface antigen, putative [Bodo saltans]|uniref:GP46-like surface antigen, putative n=1 Tax=Bodo saltans TaxID=75058 RepID=A0A0S4JFV3_BODSA|nr:GP46-like surface antigen, putative [Bodo saltans]|eukprot:CUG89350.1 GP46-like surface antigen, putative [Bodo saltans]